MGQQYYSTTDYEALIGEALQLCIILTPKKRNVDKVHWMGELLIQLELI